MTKQTRHPKPAEMADADWGRVGATLRQLREDRNMTQAALAGAAGFAQTTSIWQIENGVKPLTDERLLRVAEALQVDPLAIRRPREVAA